MKVNFLTLAAMALANIPGAAAAPADAPMGIEITERDGVTLIREVVCSKPQLRPAHNKRSMVPQRFNRLRSLMGASVSTRDAGSVSISVTAAPLAMEAAMHLNTEAALGAATTASPICIPNGESCVKWCL